MRVAGLSITDDNVPRCRTKFGERGFRHAGPTAWNSLPDHLHQINDTSLFKRRLKTELFRRAYVTLVSVSAPGRFVNSALQMLLLYCIVYCSVTPHTRCRLKLLKMERIKDYLLMEEELIKNQERLKPQEEKQEVSQSGFRHPATYPEKPGGFLGGTPT